MADLETLERRVAELDAALKAQGKANEDLKRRMAFLEQRYTDHNTAFGKIIPIIEETRLRTSAIEISVDELKGDVAGVKADVAALRRDLPTMIAETMREVLKESRG